MQQATAELSAMDPIVQPDGVNAPRLVRLSSLFDEFTTDAERRHRAVTTGVPLGPVTPFAKLNSELAGSIPDGLNILLGGPGAGKTAFALQIASTCGCPALYVSCEMTPLELFRRIAARVTGTFLGRFKTGEMGADQARRLAEQAVEANGLLAIVDATDAFAEPGWIQTAAEACRGTSEHVLVIVDSLHSWADSAGGESGEYESVSAACTTLRTLAKRLRCPVLAISERNRASFGKHAPKDKLQSGASSRKVEYTPESVLSLEATESTLPLSIHETPVLLTLAKNRNGTKGATVELSFHGALQSFREVGRG